MNFHNRRKSINIISVITITFLFFFTINTLFSNLIFNSDIISKYFSKIEKQKDYKGELYLLGVCPAFQTTTESNSKSVVITYNNKFVSIPKMIPEPVQSSLILKNNENRSPHEFNTSKLIGSSPLIAILGSSIGYINVFQFRDLFISTQKLMQNNGLWVMILLCITLLALGFRFKCIIVNPIKKLEAQINNMENENIFVHTHVKGLNEIIHLSESFNHMIDIIYSQKKENEELKIISNIDSLTSTYNHKYFFESIDNKIREGHKQIAVMFCDLDKFKLTNDTYGHEVGDLLLVETAKIMKAELKSNGMIFRYGGEEFVIILCDYTCSEAFIEGEKIRKSIAQSKILQQYSDYFPISISIGIACYPNYGLDGESLIKNADTAMYYSKQNGRNQCTIYTDDLNDFFKDCNKSEKKELLMDSALSLAEAVDAKDHYTGKHSKMVSKYSILIAENLNFTEEEKNKLRIGSLLHDCGKIGIPDNIINKPKKLSDEEFETIKNHTILGTNIIKHITNDEKIIHCIRSHHERWDGNGYPDGLSGTSIDLFAKIVCIADVYHAMISDRPYRKALTNEQVIDEFIKGKGTQFDPQLVDIVVSMIIMPL